MLGISRKSVVRILAMFLCILVLADGNSMFVLAEGLAEQTLEQAGENAENNGSQETQEASLSEEEEMTEEERNFDNRDESEATDEIVEEGEELSQDTQLPSGDEEVHWETQPPSEEEGVSQETQPPSENEDVSVDNSEPEEKTSENEEELDISDEDVITERGNLTGDNISKKVIAEGIWEGIEWSIIEFTGLEVAVNGKTLNKCVLRMDPATNKKVITFKERLKGEGWPWKENFDEITHIEVNVTLVHNRFGLDEIFESSYQFDNYPNLKGIQFEDNFKVSEYTFLSNFFVDCKELEEVNLDRFKGAAPLKMDNLFRDCTKLKSIDLSGIKDDNLTSMHAAFYGCESLEEVNFGKLDFSKVDSCGELFSGCSSLKKLDMSLWEMKGRFTRIYLTDLVSLSEVKVPANLSYEMDLPLNDKYVWRREDTKELVTEVPSGLPDSITINREDLIPIQSIIVEREYYEIDWDAEIPFKIDILPENSTYKDIEIEVKGDLIVRLVEDSDGYRLYSRRRKTGNDQITIKACDPGGAKTTVKVKVVERAVDVDVDFVAERVDLDYEYIFLKGEEYQPEFTWIKGEPWPEYSIEVTGDTLLIEDGKIIPQNCGEGKLMIYHSEYGQVRITNEIHYVVYEPVDDIQFEKETFLINSSQGINQITIPTSFINTENKTIYDKVSYSISKNDNFWLVDNGDNTATVGIYENIPGKVVLTAKALDGTGVKKTCTIINGSFVNEIRLSAPLDYDHRENYLLKTGSSVKLVTEIQPQEASNKKLVYSSSDESIATVDDKGVVKALKEGEVVITATATDESGVYGECKLCVTRPAQKVTMTLEENAENKVFLKNEDSSEFFTIKTIVTANGETTGVSQGVKYSISGTGAKNVEYQGDNIFRASAPGVVTITATTTDGSKKKASLKVVIEQGVYAFDVLAPQKTGNYVDEDESEHWIVYAGKQNVTIKPKAIYNDASKERPADKAYQNYVIELSDEAKQVFLLDKKGTGIVVPKSAAAGSYQVVFCNVCSGITKTVWIDVVAHNNMYIKSVTIGWPASIMPAEEGVQSVAVGSKVKLKGILNNGENTSGYKMDWAVNGKENTGSATIKSGNLDLTKAVVGDKYEVVLTISKNGESKSEVKEILVTAKIKTEAINLFTFDDEKIELPASLTVQSELNGKLFDVVIPNDVAPLYKVSGGKKDVLSVTQEAEGYRIRAEGIGTAKISIAMLDGSNVKKNINIKVVSANNYITKISTSGKTYYVSSKAPIAVPYTLVAKKKEAVSDARVEWKVSSPSILKVTPDIEDGAWGKCITTEERGYLWLVPSSGMLGKVTLTGTTLDGNRKTVKLTVHVVNNSKKEVTENLVMQAPAKIPIDTSGLPIVIYGKSMKMKTVFSSSKAKNKNVIFSMKGRTKSGEEVTESELNAMGVTLKNGTIKAAPKSTFHGTIEVKASLDCLLYKSETIHNISDEIVVCIQPPVEIEYMYYQKEGSSYVNRIPQNSMEPPFMFSGDNLIMGVKFSNGVDNVRIKWEVSNKHYVQIDGNGRYRKNKDCRVFFWEETIITATILDGSKQKIKGKGIVGI